MTSVNTTSIGRINSGAANPLALTTDQAGYDAKYGTYLKLFSGEMFKGFQNNTIARDLVTKRTLKNGKSLQFIYTGRMEAGYHTPGTPILGTENALPVAEKMIQMDDLLISSAFVYELDETLAHYELRGEIAKKIGYALAEKYDRLIFRAITRGARAAHPVTGGALNKAEPGGTQIRIQDTSTGGVTTGAAAYDSTALVNGFYDAAAALDEKGVSGQGRCAVLNPRQYYELIQNVNSNGLINRDVQGTALQGGNGIIEIAGIKIYKSMNIPFFGNYGTKYGTAGAANPGVTSPTNVGDFVGKDGAFEDADMGQGGINNEYGEDGEFAHSCGLIFQKEAAGVVEAIGPQVQVTNGDVSIMYQGDIILGRLAMGADYLNPAACVELIAGADPGATGAAAF